MHALVEACNEGATAAALLVIRITIHSMRWPIRTLSELGRERRANIVAPLTTSQLTEDLRRRLHVVFPLLPNLLHIHFHLVLFKLPVNRICLMLRWQFAFIDVAVCRYVLHLPKPIHIPILRTLQISLVGDLREVVGFLYLEEVLLQRRPLHFILTVCGFVEAESLPHRVVDRVSFATPVTLYRFLKGLRLRRIGHPFLEEIATFGGFVEMLGDTKVRFRRYSHVICLGGRWRWLRRIWQPRSLPPKHFRFH